MKNVTSVGFMSSHHFLKKKKKHVTAASQPAVAESTLLKTISFSIITSVLLQSVGLALIRGSAEGAGEARTVERLHTPHRNKAMGRYQFLSGIKLPACFIYLFISRQYLLLYLSADLDRLSKIA